MKPTKSNHIILTLALLALLSTLNLQLSTFAQGTAFTYQGRLNSGTNPATGLYDLTFQLFNASTGGSQTGGTITNTGVGITNGLFTVALDFDGVFNGTAYWLQINVRTNGTVSYTALTPRQPLTPTPYAITAQNLTGTILGSQLTGTVPSGLLSGTYGSILTLNNSGDSFSGNGAGLANVNALTLDGLGPLNFWQLAGNNVLAGQFLGSTNNQAVELWANGQRALRIEPTTAYSGDLPNIIGGSSVNFVASGIVGACIGGGGQQGAYTNSVNDNFGVIGGGAGNAILANGNCAVIGGGLNNVESGSRGFIGAGESNTNNGPYSTLAGGYKNSVSGNYSVIGGGWNNVATISYATIGGGYGNQILSIGSFIGGGGYDGTNFGGNIVNAAASTIGGGMSNVIGDLFGLGNFWPNTHSFIGGGLGNGIYGSDYVDLIGCSIIVGGENNSISQNSFGTIVGGMGNGLNQSDYSIICSGIGNFMTEANLGFIGGGRNNHIGPGSTAAVIVGGENNDLVIDVADSAIGGGYGNQIWYGGGAVISGGTSNTVGGIDAAIPGGFNNGARGDYSFAAGYCAQANHRGAFVWADSSSPNNFASSNTNQFLIRAQGGVGIGTTNPAAALDVQGDIKLGSTDQYFATAGAEKLRIVRGIIRPDGTTIDGTGFTVSHLGTGSYSITFSPAFADIPALIITPYTSNAPVTANCYGGTGSGYASILTWAGSSQADTWWNFIAIGGR